MAKAFKGGHTIADYGDGGSSPAGGAPRAHRGGPNVTHRPHGVPTGPEGKTSPAAFGGAPTVTANGTPKRTPGSGANNGAGSTTPQTGY